MMKQIVVYDADCGICEKCKNLLESLDWLSQFECHPLQDEALYVKFLSLRREDCEKELKLIVSKDEIIGGAEAVIKICFKLPLVMPLGWLFWIPPFRQIAQWLYPIIANNRYLISSHCKIENRQKPKS